MYPISRSDALYPNLTSKGSSWHLVSECVNQMSVTKPYGAALKMVSLLPGTEVVARGLSWEVVLSESLGQQTLFRLHGLSGEMRGREVDILHPLNASNRSFVICVKDQGGHSIAVYQPGRQKIKAVHRRPSEFNCSGYYRGKRARRAN